jgi:biopolymer transport protein TolR
MTMSVAVETAGRGGRKPINSDLNLVPYIDLLTCMVTFLLITAVWTQLASIDVAQKGASRDRQGDDEPPRELVVLVSDDGFVISGSATGAQRTLAKKEGRYDLAGLLAVLKEVRKTLPDKRDLQVAADDTVEYQHVVRAMDTAIAADFPDVSVSDAAAAHL